LIAELGADLVGKVQGIPSLTNSSSLTLGGRAADPGMLKMQTPCAWVSMKGDAEDEAAMSAVSGPRSGLVAVSQVMLGTWAVTVFVPYIDDTDLLATQYPLLEAIRAAIHATDAPSGYRWAYVGQKIALVYPDRLAYEQRYTVNYVTGSAAS
jgi:hypothetical protein